MPHRSHTQGERRKQIAQLGQDLTALIAQAPSDADLNTDDAFMDYLLKLMNVALALLHYSCALAPTNEIAVRGYPPKHAIILGHLVRIRKLYEGFLCMTANQKVELAMIFARPLHETAARMEYLLTARRSSIRSFKLASYKPEREMLRTTPRKHANNPLLDKVGARWRRKVMNRLRRDGITVKTLMANRTWSIDGLDFRALLRKLGREGEYSRVFGNTSHWTHGDWADLDWHHLLRDGRRYHPKLTFDTPDPRSPSANTVFAILAAAKYVRWAKIDRTKTIRRIMQRLIDELLRVDALHESTMMQ